MLQIVKRVRDRMRACEPIKGAAGRIRWAHHCKKIVLKFRQAESGRRVLVARSRGYLPSRKVPGLHRCASRRPDDYWQPSGPAYSLLTSRCRKARHSIEQRPCISAARRIE
jgi:hypothetical protein